MEADGVVEASHDHRASYSVVVPVRDEASVLARTVPALLAAVAGDRADIVYVCNGCTDDSAAIIRAVAGSIVRVIEIAQAGKTGALNAGDALVTAFPLFYVDADVVLRAGDFGRLARALAEGDADLVSPSLDFDLSGTTRASRMMAETWLALPYAQSGAFQIVIGLSERGRSTWGRFPDILGDDVFIATLIPRPRRRIVPAVTAITRPPSRFRGWVRARARWLQGERALAAMGLARPRAEGQRAALLRRLATPRTASGAALFLAARLLGSLSNCWPGRSYVSWRPDRTGKQP